MRAHGHAGATEIGHQSLFRIHRTQRRFGIRLGKFVEQWSGVTDGAFDLPEGVAAMEEIADFQIVDFQLVGASICNLGSTF